MDLKKEKDKKSIKLRTVLIVVLPVIITLLNIAKTFSGNIDYIYNHYDKIMETIITGELNHGELKEEIKKEPTCIEEGLKAFTCLECEKITKIESIEKLPHDFEEYVLIQKPTSDKNGIEQSKCKNCGTINNREYICTHEKTNEITKFESTCNENGIKVITCNLCEKELKEVKIEKKECIYSEWMYTKCPTFVELGEKYRVCKNCNKKEIATYGKEIYRKEMAGNTSIYIPGTEIDDVMYIGNFTQYDVDNNDIVYTQNVFSDIERSLKNPFVLGHRYGSLGTLYKTKVGQYIYIKINGELKVYQVFISEEASATSDRKNIIGNITGASLWDKYENEILRIYTCYGSSSNGRWIVFAKRIEPETSQVNN